MKKYSYDRTRAKQLLPLLESIGTEISERQERIRRLEIRVAACSDEDEAAVQVLDLKAELAVQRRGLRKSREELDKLGCTADESRGKLFFIPGRDGTLESGFRWELGQDTVRRVQADSSAA